MSKNVLIRPYVTEKTTRLMEQGQYAFVVGLKANKVEIRKAIEARYPGAKVEKVRTMVMPGKTRRQFRRGGMNEGRTPPFKKAIVTVDPSGEQIDFFESI